MVDSTIPNCYAAIEVMIGIGWGVFPCHSIVNGKCSCNNDSCKNQGKHPRTLHGHKDATTDMQQIVAWMRAYPEANWGARPQKNAFVADLDGPSALESWNKLHEEHGIPRQPRWRSKTGSGGQHFFFTYPEGTAPLVNKARSLPGIDVRTEDGYILLPGSNHFSGGMYEWIVPPEGTPEVAMPELIEALRPIAVRTVGNAEGIDAATVLSGIPEGQRDEKLFLAACRIRRQHQNDPDGGYAATRVLILAAAAAANPPFPQDQALAKVEQAFKQDHSDIDANGESTKNPAYFPKTDHGNAKRLAHYFGKTMRYIRDRDEWLIWDGAKWFSATEGDLLYIADQVTRKIYTEAGTFQDQADRDAHAKWGKKTHFVAGAKSLIMYAKGLPELWSERDDFDRNDHLLNVLNGTVNLRSGELIPHDPKNMLTGMVALNYDPVAESPLWQSMVHRSVAEAARIDPEIVGFLQKVFGYMLFGDNAEEFIFFGIGPEQCGKSKLGSIITDVLGFDYAHVAKPEIIAKTPNGHHESEIFSMMGKRIAFISETSSTFNMDENRVKGLTGEKFVPTRKMHAAKEIHVRRTWTLFLASNYDPNIAAWDGAIARRVVKIPFGPTIPVEERDTSLPFRILMDESEGVLAWLVRGAVAYYTAWIKANKSTGLEMPISVKMATKIYADESDHIGRFIEEMVNRGEGQSVAKSAVVNAFSTWGKRYEKVVNRNTLYKRLLQLPGVTEHRGREFRGMSLRLDNDLTQGEIDWMHGQSGM